MERLLSLVRPSPVSYTKYLDYCPGVTYFLGVHYNDVFRIVSFS